MTSLIEVTVDKCYKGGVDGVIKVAELGGRCTAKEYIDANGFKEKDFYDQNGGIDGNADCDQRNKRLLSHERGG